ncbi:MAG: CysB family HTH-type transcriptional regulator [Betaproteobacteria bacterium]|nr:CysB family HTH-type transcriptional regulator [Betaproteobacteria bacterium]
MNIHQLRAICEVVKQGLRMSNAAEALFRSQPGVSRQVRDIEDEIGIRIFRRKKNKIEALTPAGREVVRVAERVLRDIDSLRLIGKEYSSNDMGELTVATTHTHARYSLPRAIEAFTVRFPKVKVTLRQGNPVQCCELAALGEVDLAIATETSRSYEDLLSLPVYRVTRCIVAPRNHPVLKEKRLTLETLAQYPIIAFDTAFSGRRVVSEAFSQAGLAHNVVLSAVDPDVTKAYVERGMGIAILSRLAYDPVKDRSLGIVDASHLFKSSLLNVSMRRHTYLRSYVLSFIELYAPHLSREAVRKALESDEPPPPPEHVPVIVS